MYDLNDNYVQFGQEDDNTMEDTIGSRRSESTVRVSRFEARIYTCRYIS